MFKLSTFSYASAPEGPREASKLQIALSPFQKPEGERRIWLQYLLLIAVSITTGILFIREPGFGDELTYWSLAFDLHDIGPSAWNLHSFHDLRWPVWGVSWLWQCFFGPGLASFYCGPILYLAAAASLVFTYGRLVLRSLSGAWVCALALLFAPVLDAVINRSMPDLSEGVFTGAALLTWWMMMQATDSRRAWLFGLLSGICIGVAFSNRVTGIFIAPVLALATLLFFPHRWKWLLIPAATALFFMTIEGAVYYSICGDWLHSIHANLGNARAKDVEVMPFWRLPIRYLAGFFRANRLAPVYAVLACGGLATGWRRWGTPGKLIVVWFAVLYLEYSCAIQSIHPVRPLIGSTFRYLAVFAVPMSLLVGMGAIELYRILTRIDWAPVRTFRSNLAPYPAMAAICAFATLVLLTSRPLFDRGFTVEFRRYMAALPNGTRIFSHHAMHDLACMVDADAARRFVWIAPKAILSRKDDLEDQAASCNEFWYIRKLIWLTERKKVEHGLSDRQPPLASYFEFPERDWKATNILEKGDKTDMVLSRRRLSGAPPAHLLEGDELGSLIPALPAVWKSQQGPTNSTFYWTVPSALRGKLLTFQINAASDAVEPLNLKLDFLSGNRSRSQATFQPIVYGGGGTDFFAVQIPLDADSCTISLRFNKNAKEVRLIGFRAEYEE